MAEAPAQGILSLEEIFVEMHNGDPNSMASPATPQELEEFLRRCKIYRVAAEQEREERDAEREPEQQDVIQSVRYHLKELEELQDILVRDTKRIFPKYTKMDLIKKIISLSPYKGDPEVIDVFETDENGKMNPENIKKVSDMLGPYASRIERGIQDRAIVPDVHSYEHFFTCTPELLNIVYEAVRELERFYDAANLFNNM